MAQLDQPAAHDVMQVLGPDREVVGAEHLHHVMRRWLVELGHDAYRDEARVSAAGDGGSPPASR